MRKTQQHEQRIKSRQLLFEHALDGLDGDVRRRDARAAGGDDDIYVLLPRQLAQSRSQYRTVVRDQFADPYAVAVFLQQILNEIARLVIFRRAGVLQSNQGDSGMAAVCLLLMIQYRVLQLWLWHAHPPLTTHEIEGTCVDWPQSCHGAPD